MSKASTGRTAQLKNIVKREKLEFVNPMKFIQKAWQGQERLWIVFWIYGVLVTVLLELAKEAFELKGIYPAIFDLVYSFFFGLILWRCAYNVKWRGWGILARVVAVLNIAKIFFVFLSPFAVNGLKNEGNSLTGDFNKVVAEMCKADLDAYKQRGGKDEESFMKNCLAGRQASGSATSPASATTPAPQ